MKLSKTSITTELVGDIDNLFNTINDLKRIGDHCENISELAEIAIQKDADISEDGVKAINEMYEKVKQNCEDIINVIKDKDTTIANKIIHTEEQVNKIEKSIRRNHIYRLNNDDCKIDAGILYLDLITNLERISDHCANVAKRVLN